MRIKSMAFIACYIMFCSRLQSAGWYAQGVIAHNLTAKQLTVICRGAKLRKPAKITLMPGQAKMLLQKSIADRKNQLLGGRYRCTLSQGMDTQQQLWTFSHEQALSVMSIEAIDSPVPCHGEYLHNFNLPKKRLKELNNGKRYQNRQTVGCG